MIKGKHYQGLFHDIVTPVFKHCVDFLNDDYMKQESTEDLTTKIISESKEIMSLLRRDNILLEEVDDYHKFQFNKSEKFNINDKKIIIMNKFVEYY